MVVSNSAGTATSSNAILSLIVPRPGDAVAGLQWQGLSNLAYTVQAKTNIEETNWFTVGTASAPGATLVHESGRSAAAVLPRGLSLITSRPC